MIIVRNQICKEKEYIQRKLGNNLTEGKKEKRDKLVQFLYEKDEELKELGQSKMNSILDHFQT